MDHREDYLEITKNTPVEFVAEIKPTEYCCLPHIKSDKYENLYLYICSKSREKNIKYINVKIFLEKKILRKEDLLWAVDLIQKNLEALLQEGPENKTVGGVNPRIEESKE